MEPMNRRQFSKRLAAIGATLMASGELGAGLFLIGCSTTWIDTAIADIPEVTSIAQTVVALIEIPDPGLNPATGALINVSAKAAIAALQELKALIIDYKAAPSDTVLGKIKAGVLDAQTNFSSIISQLSSVTSAKLLATITQGGSLSLSVLSAILSLLPPSMAASRTYKASRPVKLLTPSQVKSQFNTVAAANGYTSHQI